MHIFREGGNTKLDNNDFILKIVAELEQKGIKTGFDKLKKELEKDPAKIDVILNTSGTVGRTKGSIKKLAAELHNELSVEINKLQKQGQDINFDLSVGDVEEVIQNVINHTKKLEQNFDSASAKAQKFLAQFNKKSGGVLINSDEFKAVQTAINGLGNTHTIDDLNKSMNTLEVTYNNMVSSLRNSGKSLNPFINAKNEMAVMDETINGIGLEFEKLSTKPKFVADSIKQLSVQQSKVNSYTIGTQEWADAYGKLQQMIQKVNAEISNLSKAKSANVATHILNTEDLDKQGKIYIQKISNTIEKTKSELESKLRNAGYTDIEIKGVEDAKGKIKSLTATVTDATGAFKQLNFERAKIQGNGKAQAGFVQTDDVKVVGNISSAIDKVKNNLSSLKTKWEEQGVLVGEFKTKVEQLESSLSSVGSKSELNGLKTQIQDLKNEASTLSRINEIQLSIDNGHGASEYQNRINSITTSLEKYGVATKEAQKITASLQTTFDKMKNLSGKELITQADKLEQEFKAVKASVEQAKIAYDKYMQPVSNEKATSLINRINTFLSKNTKITKEARAELEGYVQELNKGVNLNQWNQINSKFKETENSMRLLHRLGASFKDQISQAVQNFTQWLSVSSVIMFGVHKSTQAISELKEIDSILTEINKTSDLTIKQLKELGNTSFDSASFYGKKAPDYLVGVQEMSRSGFYGEKGTAMAEQSLLAQAAGDLTADIANNYILATNAAYKYGGEAKKLNEVLDGQNSITNRNSVAMNDMAIAMSEAGTVASSYRVSIEDLSAMIGTIESVTKLGGSEVGNSIKAILINLQNITSDKIVNTLDAANASMTEMVDGTEKLRNPIEILRDLATTFNQLDEKDPLRAEILTNIGQKYHAAKLGALLQNMEMFDKMLIDYSEGSGSAMEEAMKSANNWEGSLNRVNNTWTKIINNIVDSDTIIFALNGFNSILSTIDKITDKLGSLGNIGLGAGLLVGFQNVGRPKMFGLICC